MSAIHSPIERFGRELRSGRLTSVDLVRQHIARIDAVNGTLNAVVVRRDEDALAEAERADEELAAGRDRGPLHGIPCTIKEFLAIEGLPHTGGLTCRADVVASQDATLVTRLREAGVIMLGHTNAPEGGLWHETNNPLYGRTSNPHDIRRTSGGSSGGEGAAIASGMSPFGIGSDVGGSIRFPSAFCGIYGLKPTHGLLPNTGHYPEAPPKPFMTCGPMARSARDLMPVMRALAGPDGRDPVAVEHPMGSEWDVDLSKVTVFKVPQNGSAWVHQSMVDAIDTAGDWLAARGATVVPLSIPELRPAFEIWAVLMGEMGVSYDALVTEGGRISLRRELLRYLRGRSGHTGSVLTMVAVQRLIHRLPDRVEAMEEALRALRDRLAVLLEPGHVLLHPPFARVAPRHRTIALGSPMDVGLSSVFNILGLPSCIAPVGTHQGLPTSVQIIGGPFQDATTCAVAIAMEDAKGELPVVDPRKGPRWRPLERM